MHHRIVIIILARFKGFNIAFIAPPFIIYQNSIHVVGMTIACLVSQHSAMFESPGLFVVRRPSANSRWGGVQLIYYMLCYCCCSVGERHERSISSTEHLPLLTRYRRSVSPPTLHSFSDYKYIFEPWRRNEFDLYVQLQYIQGLFTT